MVRSISRVLVVVLALLALVGTVSAQINGPANGFIGGDNLFCDSTRGCWLLNSNRPANGSVPVLLGEFPQADIQGALATCAASASNVIINTIQGTYGPFTLSAVYDGPNASPACSLQINAFEGEGKESKPYSFAPKDDGNYSPVPQPVPVEEEVVVSVVDVLHFYCVFDLVPGNFFSADAIHRGIGFDLMEWTIANPQRVFVRWVSLANPYPPCV